MIGKRSTVYWALGLFVLALAVRMVFIYPLRHGQGPVSVDYFESIAWNLAQGNGYSLDGNSPTAYRSPAYPVLLAGLYALLGGRAWFAAHVLTAVLSALTVSITYLTGLRLFSHKIGAIAAGVAAFYPEFSFVAAVLYSENLFNFLLALGMLMLIKISTEEARTWEKLVAGICLALAALARLEAASLFPLVVVWIFWLTGFKLVDTIKLGAFLLLPGILLVSIWAVRNYYAMHAFIPATTSGGVTLFGVHNDTTFNDRSAMGDWIGARWLPNWDELGSMPEIERDRALFQMALVSIRRNLARLPALEAYKLHNFVLGISPGKVVQRFPIVFFAITGLITSWWVARRKCSILYVLLLYYLTNALVFYTSERLRTGVEPYLFILAVFGAFEYWGLLANYRASAQIARQQK